MRRVSILWGALLTFRNHVYTQLIYTQAKVNLLNHENNVVKTKFM